MNLELHLRLVGMIQLALAAAHVPFPRMFNWKAELATLSLLNRQIFIVHTLFIVLVLVMFGTLALCAPTSLIEPTRLGILVCAGLAVFWMVRLGAQFFVYDSRLWRGDASRTFVHVAISIVWLYLTLVYCAAFAAQYASHR